MNAEEDAERLGHALMGIVGNKALPIDMGPYREECDDSRPRNASAWCDEAVQIGARRVYLRSPSLSLGTWSALAAGLRRLGWEAEADETGINTHAMRVTLDTSDVVNRFTIAERRST